MRNIPIVTKNLLILNIVAFLATLVVGTNASGSYVLNDLLGLHFFMAEDFHLYQLVTYMFMHGGWSHIIFNMFALWMFGCIVERVWGTRKFLFYYIACGVGAGLFQEAAQFVEYSVQGLAAYESVDFGTSVMSMNQYLNLWTTVGASGAIYAILLAFGMTFPEERIFIFPLPVPIKAKWFVLIYAAVELFSALGTSHDGVAHIAHLGGMVFGYFMIRYWRQHPGGNYYQRGSSAADAFNKLKDMLGGKRGRQHFTYTRYDNNWQHYDAAEEVRDQEGTTDSAAGKVSQEVIDRILDKIRKSGYDSLTKEEKQTLFDQSKR